MMKTKWIGRALFAAGKSQKELARAMKLDGPRMSKVVNEEPDRPELTYERTVALAKFLGLSMDAVCARLGAEARRTNFTLHHARFVAERFGISMDQLSAKLGEEVFVW
jgi:transcriptional regulator with XRE-family HTH domain